MGVLEDIRENYPTLAFLLNDSQVGPLLRRAVDPTATYSPGRFQAELMQTKWWKSRSQSAREADILFHTDPGTYRANIRTIASQVRQRAAQLGVGATAAEINWIANQVYRGGVDPGGPVLDQGLLALRRKPGNQRKGLVHTNAVMARQLAKNQYYFVMAPTSARRWGEQLATGEKTQEDLNVWMSEQAASKYPWLKRVLGNGNTVEDVFSEHRAAIARTLELDPNQLDLTKSNWRKVIDYHDPVSKQRRMMTVGEAEYLARQDPRYWKTKEGRTADAQAAQMVLQMFGKRSI